MPGSEALRSGLAKMRRLGWFIPAFFAFLSLPALLQAVLPPPTLLGAENRRPAPLPAWPATIAEAWHLPPQVDAWLADRFGLRNTLVRLNARLRWIAFGELSSPRLIIGRNGRIFLGEHDGSAPGSLITTVCGVDQPAQLARLGAETVRRTIAAATAAGFAPTVLIVPTPARLYPEDLPVDFAARCAGHTPLGDAVAAQLADAPVIYPVQAMLALKTRTEAIPRHHFHWAGEAPLRVAELVAGQHWGLPRSFPLPLARVSRSSDLQFLAPGAGLSDMIDAPQRRPAGMRTCHAAACAVAGLPPGAAAPLEIHTRPGTGRLLVIANSFGDEIAPDFTEYFSEVWHVSLTVTPGMSAADRSALAAVLNAEFRGSRVLLVLHDLGTTLEFDRRVGDVLEEK